MFLESFLMIINVLSLILNSILFILALIYFLLKYHQNKENVQSNSEEYSLLKYSIILLFIFCLIFEIQVIISLNMENIAIENIYQRDSLNIIIWGIVSNALFVSFFICFFPSLFLNNSTEIKLPYPSRHRAKEGQLEMGRIKFGNKKKYRFKLSVRDLERHMFICGSTGSGKTNFHQRFLTQLDKTLKVPFLLCEFKGEYQFLQRKIKDLLVLKPGYNFFINIFDPEGTDPKVHAERLFQAFRSGMKFEDKEFSPQMERVFVDILVQMCMNEEERNWEAFTRLSKDYFSTNSSVFNGVRSSVEQSIYAIQNRIRR